jgi:hypothetical protein
VILTSLLPLKAQTPPKPALPSLSIPLKTPGSTVVCGTTILAGKPALDPKFVKPAPEGHFTLQVATPRMCATESSALNTRGLPVVVPRGELPDRLPMFLGPQR